MNLLERVVVKVRVVVVAATAAEAAVLGRSGAFLVADNDAVWKMR